MDNDIFDLEQSIEMAFVAEDLIGYWPIILAKYKDLGFTDKISDEQRIQEFTYITDQLRKYIGTKRNAILKHKEHWTDMLEEMNDIVSKLEDKASSRKEIAYLSLRNEWITGLYQLISIRVDLEIEGEDE